MISTPLLEHYRRILNSIHSLGSIWYDEGRFKAYALIARLASDERERVRKDNGSWVPACGGSETPFVTRSGFRLLYCWQPSTGRHAYINVDTDIALSDEEARAALGTY